MATEGEVQFEDREQNNEQLLEILQVRRENSGDETVPVEFVGGGDGNDGTGALILQSQEIELNGERHVILQQAQDSETGELLVVLQGANGEPIALSSEALSSMQGLVQVSGAEGEQMITLAVSQENAGQQMVVITDSSSSTVATLPVESLASATSRFSLSSTTKAVSNLCSTANASTNVVQAVETPRMATHQEQSSSQPIFKAGERIKDLTSTDDSQNVNGSETRIDETTKSVAVTEKVEKESGSIVEEDSNGGDKGVESGVDFTSAVIQVQDSNSNTALETLMANAVVSAADNNFVVMTTEDSGMPTEINLADVISAGSASGQTFFIETSEGLVACTSASTAEDGSIQLVAADSGSNAALLTAPHTEGQILQNVGNNSVTYTLQSTPSGIELTPLTNVQSPVKQQPLKQKPVRQSKTKTISTTKAGETLLLPSSITNKSVVAPVSVTNTNSKTRAVPLRNTKSATGIHVTVTPQSSYSSNIIPVQPDNSSSHLKSIPKTSTGTSVSAMLTTSTPAASQLAASRRTYSKKNNIVWLNPEQTTVTTVSRSPTASTTSVPISSSPTTPVKNKTTVTVFSGTKSSIPSSGLTIVKTDTVSNDLNAKVASLPSTPSPDKKRETPTKAAPKDVQNSPVNTDSKTTSTSISISSASTTSTEVTANVANTKISIVSPLKSSETTKAKPKTTTGETIQSDHKQEKTQGHETKSDAKVSKQEKSKEIDKQTTIVKEIEKKSKGTKEIHEQQKVHVEPSTEDMKTVKALNTRSSKSKNIEANTSVSKADKSESLPKNEKSQKKDTDFSKSTVKSTESNSSKIEQPKEIEKKGKERDSKRKVESIDESKSTKSSKSRNQAKQISETKKKTEVDEKSSETSNNSSELKNTEKRSSGRRKVEEVANDQKEVKLRSSKSETRSSKSKESAEFSETTKLSDMNVVESNSVEVLVNEQSKLTKNEVTDINVQKTNELSDKKTSSKDKTDESEKPKETEKRTRDAKRKSEELNTEKTKSLKMSKAKSVKTKTSEKSENESNLSDVEGHTTPKKDSQEKSKIQPVTEIKNTTEDLKNPVTETPRERRTREVRKKVEIVHEEPKSEKSTKLKVNFKLDEKDSEASANTTGERLSSGRKKRKIEEESKRERSTRSSTTKSTPEPELVPILKKSRPSPIAPKSVERVSMLKSFGEAVDVETEEMEKRNVVSSIIDSRSPAERYDFVANDCQFHIRHQSTSLSPFTPRGSGGSYMCQKCGYKTTRMNNLVLHHKDQCPVVKSAVMLLWENEIRKQTKKPQENSTPVVDEYVTNKRKLDLDVNIGEIYDTDGDMEEDDEEKAEKGDSIMQAINEVKPVTQDTVLLPSDEEDENSGNDAVKKCFGFEEKEIVWADFEGVHWPALVVKVHDKDKEVTVKLIDSSIARKWLVILYPICHLVVFCYSVKMSVDKVKPFDNAEVNKRLLSEGKAIHGDGVVKAVQKAEDYSRKRCLGDENGAAKLFEDLNEYREPLSDEERLDDERLDENVVENSNGKQNNTVVVESDDSSDLRDLIENSAQWKERRRISNSKLLQCIKDGKIENHLLGVYRETIPSDRHIKFKTGSDAEKSQLKHVPWFGPIDDEDQQEEIYDYCSQLFKGNFKPDGSFDTVAYLFEVWVPEAIVKAISRIRRIELSDAEAIFVKGVILSKSEKVELEKEILKEAEKQATTNTSSN
ncbi:hypothetical protein B4U80_00179 [Leptotrombidium deliense]|uniref:PWWP domain-containing protein n=1 Tax=Leptotrombidium deliense TaxID=299467 RepID=A0A443SSY5_9ACAR|nr:hypothetical protein B4U80_00179 [Leptotrombidium deliense]